MGTNLLFKYPNDLYLKKLGFIPVTLLFIITGICTAAAGLPATTPGSYFHNKFIPSTTDITTDINPSCFGSNITLTATVTPNLATGTIEFFDRAISLGISTIGGGIATLNIATLSAGSHALTAVYSGDVNYVISTSPVLTQLVDAAIPVTPGSISGTTPVCAAVTGLVYSIAAVTDATTYTWNVPAGWSITAGAGTISITVTSGSAGGDITVTAGNACGNSAVQTKTITVTPVPAMPGTISGPTSVCPSTTGLVYSIAAVPNATSYTWTFPGGWSITAGSGTVSATLTSGASSGNIAVAAVNVCGSSASGQTININPVNATNNTGYTDNTNKFSDGIVTSSSGQRGYLKFPLTAIPAGNTVTASVLKLTNNANAVNSGSGNQIRGLSPHDPVSATATNLFAAAATGNLYNGVNWPNIGQISLTLSALANTDITNSITAPGYIAMGLLRGSPTIYNFFGYSSGANAPILTVTYSSIRTLAVTVNPGTPAVPGTISGNAAACPNSVGNGYSITSVTNATTYTWTVPTGWTITGGQGTISITATAGNAGQNGNITVTAGNSCGTSAAKTLAVTVNTRPTVSASPITQEVCSGINIGTITITNPNGVAGTTFSWTRDNFILLPPGIAASGTGSTITGSLNNITGAQLTTNFTINATANGCTSASPALVAVVVNPNPSANAGVDQGICAVSVTTIGGTAAVPTGNGGTPGYTYLWTAGVSSNSIANPTAPPGTYTVTVTDLKGCQASDAVTISVNNGTKTWIGNGTFSGGPDNNFQNPLNWSPVGVPGPCNDVVMPIDVTNILNLFSGSLTNVLTANATIKSLQLTVSGTIILSTNTSFKLDVAGNAFNILNATTINTNASTVLATPAKTYINVNTGGVLTYGGNLTTTSSNGNTNYPFYATNNNTGKVYINANADLGGIGSDPANKPSQVIFNGAANQTITQNSGSQPISLSASSTEIGETNSPNVILAGAGSGGFYNIGDLNINNTSTLDIGTTQSMNRFSVGGTIRMAAGSFMKLGRGTGGVPGSNFPWQYSAYIFNATSTVDYNASTGQTIASAPLYGNLTISTLGSKVPNANLTVQKNITIRDAAILAGNAYTITLGGNWTNYNQTGFVEQTSIVNFNGTGAQTINTAGGEIFYGLQKTAAGTVSMLSDVAVQGGGTSAFTLSAGIFDAGTFTFNSASSPLNISAGLLKLAKTGASLLPEFAITPYNIIGGTIELYGAGNQVLRGARDYRNLTFSTSGIKTVSSAITLITGTVLTQNTVTLDVSNNTMGGAGTNLTMSGTSLYKTAGTGTKPDAQGTYSLGTGTTVEFTNNAATTEDIRLTAPTYYNVIVSGTNVANTSLGTGIRFQAGGNFTVKNGGLFKLGNSAGFSGALTTSVANTNNPSIVLEDGSTVEYYGGPAGTNPQTITNVLAYSNLNFSGGSVKTAPAGTLTVKGNLSNSNSGFAHNNGTLLLNGTLAQNYNSTGTVLNYYNLSATNAAGVNINGDLGVVNLLSLGTTGKLNLASGNISLRSGALNTAAVDKISLPNSITYSGTGQFVVERYIPSGPAHAKTWQFLAAPAFGQSVNASWQEGNAPLAVGALGLGTTLSSEKTGAVARGFDFYTAPGPSIKSFNSASNTWVGIDDGVTATSSLQLANNKGYMLFVRGDRSVQTSATAANPTTLRSLGKLYSPGTDAPASSAVAAAKFESVGNPYASSIDFTNVTSSSTGIDSKYYLWDPLLGGTNGFGAYQTISSVTGWLPTPGGTTNYPTGVPYTKVQSGQAFFVYSTPGGTVNFNENNKLTGSQMVYRQQSSGNTQFIKTWLCEQQGKIADGNVVAFDDLFTNDLDADDAIKISNTGENFAVSNNDKILTVDTRKPITLNDTIFYNFSGLRTQPYQLKIFPENMNPVLNAYFVDQFNATRTAVSLTDSTTIDFQITQDAASASPGRFYIVFTPSGPVPVTIVDITATRTANEHAAVTWSVDNEINIDHYELERSSNARNFITITSSLPGSNTSIGNTYEYLDQYPYETDNFYRIKATSQDGHIQYSKIVRLSMRSMPDGISVYPNPVANKTIRLYFINQEQGNYKLQLVNELGQSVYRGEVTVSSPNEEKQIRVAGNAEHGNYHLIIILPDKGKKRIENLIIE